MAHPSLGLIETIGLAAAIEAADAAVKSANVTLVGYELTKGDGMTIVKVQGDVGAVKAAIAAAAAAAARINTVVSTQVIARPADGIQGLVVTPDTVGARHPTPQARTPVDVPAPVTPPAQADPDQASPSSSLPVSEPEAFPTSSGDGGDGPASPTAPESDGNASKPPQASDDRSTKTGSSPARVTKAEGRTTGGQSAKSKPRPKKPE